MLEFRLVFDEAIISFVFLSSDANNKVLAVNNSYEFYISTETIPKEYWDAIAIAMEQANKEMGAERIKFGGIYIGSKAIKDNVSSIFFGSMDNNGQNILTKQTSYWSNGKIDEVDIILNTKDFDFSRDQEQLVSSLKTQFKKIFGL